MARNVAHLLRWHTPACLGDRRCLRAGAVKVNFLGWHRYLADRGTR